MENKITSVDLTNIPPETGESRKGRGPQTELPDPQLITRREDFVRVFEGLWGEIGWGLQKCKRADDLIQILLPLSEIEFIRKRASLFLREPSVQVQDVNLRALRAELQDAEQSGQRLDASIRQSLEYLRRLNNALVRARPSHTRLIKREQKRGRKYVSQASVDRQHWSQTQKDLDGQVFKLEGDFARVQTFDFLSEKRYALTPLNLANAVSGLPYMGWRQSMHRCIGHKSQAANRLDYEIFKAISFISKDAKRTSLDVLTSHFRDGIFRLPNRFHAVRDEFPLRGDVPVKDELASKWFYLESAIRRAFQNKPRPKAYAFEIAKYYFRQVRAPHTEAERLVVPLKQLRLEKGSPETIKHRRQPEP